MSQQRRSFDLSALVGLLTGCGLLGTAALTALPVVAPLAAKSYGIPTAWIGYQFSLVAVAMACSLLFMSSAAIRWGGIRVCQAGLLLVGMGLWLITNTGLVFGIAGSIAMGFGYALTSPAIAHLLMRSAPTSSRNLVFSIQQTGVPLGSLLAAAAGPAMSLAIGWQRAFGLLAVAIVVWVIALQARRSVWDNDRNAQISAVRDPLSGIRMVLKDARLWRMGIAGACFSGAQFCLVTFTVVALVEQLGYGLVLGGMILTACQATGVGFRLFCGWLADYWRDSIRVLVWIATALLVVGFASFLLDQSWPVWAVCVLFVGFGFATLGWPGVFFAEVGRLSPPGQISNSTAGVMLITNVGKMIVPIGFATIQSFSGSYSFTLGWLGLLGGVALLALWSAQRCTTLNR